MEDTYYLVRLQQHISEMNPSKTTDQQRTECPLCKKSAHLMRNGEMGLHWMRKFKLPCFGCFKTPEQARGNTPWGNFVLLRSYRFIITDRVIYKLSESYNNINAKAAEMIDPDRVPSFQSYMCKEFTKTDLRWNEKK